MARTAIAEKAARDVESGSFIRRMFEEGRELRARYGAANVYDFTLGNPTATPPQRFFDALRETAIAVEPALHRYMPNAGFDDARTAVAEFLSAEYRTPIDRDGVLLTSGAAGALNVLLRAICDPDDEVIVLTPYFPEYRFYIEHSNARMVTVPTDARFQPDVARLAAALSPRTRAVLLNSPNNPTGAVYEQDRLDEIAALLTKHDRPDRPIYLLLDDPYRRVLFDRAWCPTPLAKYHRAVVASSYAKDLSIAGERMGYVAAPTSVPERKMLMDALTNLNRTLGFVNAGAFLQRVITRCADACCDVEPYRANAELLCGALERFGYSLVRPAGALYAFPRTPIDDREFTTLLKERERILVVPGSGFAGAGHVRVSICVPRATIEGALPGFERALQAARR